MTILSTAARRNPKFGGDLACVSSNRYLGRLRRDIDKLAKIRSHDSAAGPLARRQPVPRELARVSEWIGEIPNLIGRPDVELILPIEDAHDCARSRIREIGATIAGVESDVPWRGAWGECFANARMVASVCPDDLAYAEGLAVASTNGFEDGWGLACWHAWLVDRRGRVHDPTWDNGVWYHGALVQASLVAHLSATQAVLRANMGYASGIGGTIPLETWVRG